MPGSHGSRLDASALIRPYGTAVCSAKTAISAPISHSYRHRAHGHGAFSSEISAFANVLSSLETASTELRIFLTNIGHRIPAESPRRRLYPYRCSDIRGVPAENLYPLAQTRAGDAHDLDSGAASAERQVQADLVAQVSGTFVGMVARITDTLKGRDGLDKANEKFDEASKPF